MEFRWPVVGKWTDTGSNPGLEVTNVYDQSSGWEALCIWYDGQRRIQTSLQFYEVCFTGNFKYTVVYNEQYKQQEKRNIIPLT